MEQKQNGFLITLLSVLLLIAVFIAGFFAYQTQNLVKELTKLQVTPTPTTTVFATEEPIIAPSITSPLEGESIFSPVTITGFVPAGWMFEGISPVKILDKNRKLIKQGVVKEKMEGSWMRNEPVEFITTLTFSTTASSGYIVLENDNPSGLKENYKMFEVSVNFSQNTVACTMEAKICPDGSSVGRSGPKCEFSPCPTPKS